MSKYSKEFKLKVVKYCIEKHHSSYDAAKEFEIEFYELFSKNVNEYVVIVFKILL